MDKAAPPLTSNLIPSPLTPPSPTLPSTPAPLPPLLQRPAATFPPGPHPRIAFPPSSLFLSSHYRALGLLPPSLPLLSSAAPPPQYALSASHIFHSLHASSVTSLALESIESRYLLSADSHGLIALYDTLPPLQPGADPVPPLSTSTVTTGRGAHYAVNSLCWYPVDTGAFLTGGNDGKVHTWDTNSFAITHSFTVREAQVNGVAMSGVSAQHALVAVVSSDHNVRLVDLHSAGFAHTLIGHAAEVTTVAWTPFSEFLLVTGSVDKVSGHSGGRGTAGALHR